MGRDHGRSDASSVSQEMSDSKQTNNSCSFQPTYELMKRKTEWCWCLSIRRRRPYWWAVLEGGWSANVHWSVISQISAFIFCSTLLRPGDFFQPNIDWQRKDWWGLQHELACPGDTSIPLQQFALNRQDEVTGCLVALSPDIPLCLE